MAAFESAVASEADLKRALEGAVTAVTSVVRGHDEVVQLALAAMLARGHVLFEDVPGVGKTTLARTLAKVLGSSFARIQFTSDLLPSDVLGVQVLDKDGASLRFRKGPIFADVVLADEINRASPKTQSALLEAMAERKVSVDDTTYSLAPTFTVLATQNPLEHHGAYPLPESQLDRFMVRLSLGYPSQADERALILAPAAPEQALEGVSAMLSPEVLLALQKAAASVHLSEAIADYVLAVVAATRTHKDVVLGASPRASMALAALARAWALLAGRSFVLPDDVQRIAASTLAHRLVLGSGEVGTISAPKSRAVIDDILATVAVPR